jgi:segregation and condensation protein A
MAGSFKERELAQSKLFCREVDEASLFKQFPPVNPLGSVELSDLIAAYGKILRKIEKRREVVSITREEVTIQERIDSILYSLQENSAGMSFYQLFSGMTERSEIIMTFLALLELSRRGIVFLRQNTLFGDILVFLRDNERGQESAHSVS